MELAAAVLGVVETVAPVHAQESDHREEDTDADTGTALDLERVELADVRPAVTALEEAEDIDGGLRLEDHRVAEFHRKLVVDVAGVGTGGAVRRDTHRREGIVLITTQGDDFRSVGHVSRHTVTAHLEAFERGIAPVAVVVAEETELRPAHQHEVTHQFGIDGTAEFPLVVLDPLVAVRGAPLVLDGSGIVQIGGVVIDVLPAADLHFFAVLESVFTEQRIRRSHLHGGGEVGSHAGIDLLVRGVAAQGERVAQVMGDTVVEGEIAVVPVGQLVGLPAQVVVQDKVVVRPLEAVPESGVETEHLEHAVRGQDADVQVGVRHPGIVTGQAQGSRLLAEEPGLHEAGAEGGVVPAVRLETEGKRLRVAQRDRTPGILLEHPVRGEIVETHARRGDEGIAAPAAGEFQRGGRLLRHVIHQVHRVVELVGDDGVTALAHDGFRVELAQGGDFADGTLEIRLAEQVARPGHDLAADHFLVGKVVAVDDDVVQGGRLAFGDAHLNVHGVVLDVHLHRGDVEEQVTVVPVQLGDVVIRLLAAAVETLFHGDHVVDVPLLDLQDLVQDLGGIDRVAGPGHVAEIVFRALVEHHVDRDVLRVHVIDGVPHQAGVAVTGLVEGIQDGLPVRLVLFLLELQGLLVDFLIRH